MSDIEGRGLQSLSHADASPRLRPPRHHQNVRVGIATRRQWISFAGVLLLISAGIGFYTSAQLFNQASQARPADPVASIEVGGVVQDSVGDVIAGATVLIIETGNQTTTNADGWYAFEGVPPGSYTIEAAASGYTTVAKRVVLQSAFPRLIDFELTPGTGRVVLPAEREPNFTNPAAGAYALAVAVLFASGMAAAGGVSAVRHRHYIVAVTGAAAGVLTLGYFIGSIMSLVALAVLASLRHGFREAEFHHLPWEEAPDAPPGGQGDSAPGVDAPHPPLPPPPGARPGDPGAGHGDREAEEE